MHFCFRTKGACTKEMVDDGQGLCHCSCSCLSCIYAEDVPLPPSTSPSPSPPPMEGTEGMILIVEKLDRLNENLEALMRMPLQIPAMVDLAMSEACRKMLEMIPAIEKTLATERRKWERTPRRTPRRRTPGK